MRGVCEGCGKSSREPWKEYPGSTKNPDPKGLGLVRSGQANHPNLADKRNRAPELMRGAKRANARARRLRAKEKRAPKGALAGSIPALSSEEGKQGKAEKAGQAGEKTDSQKPEFYEANPRKRVAVVETGHEKIVRSHSRQVVKPLGGALDLADRAPEEEVVRPPVKTREYRDEGGSGRDHEGYEHRHPKQTRDRGEMTRRPSGARLQDVERGAGDQGEEDAGLPVRQREIMVNTKAR